MLQVPSQEEFNKLAALVTELNERLAYAEAIGDKWVKPDVAARLTGRDEKTLRAERDRPGTPLVCRVEGRRVEYSVQSLKVYNQRRGYSPAITAQRAAVV